MRGLLEAEGGSAAGTEAAAAPASLSKASLAASMLCTCSSPSHLSCSDSWGMCFHCIPPWQVNRVASATAAARQARRRSPGPAALPPLPALNWQQGLGALARQRSASEGRLAAVPQQLEPTTPRGSAETITAAQRLAAISPGPLSNGAGADPGSPSVLAASKAPGWPQAPAWAAAAPGSPRAVRSSAPARPANWQRQVAALEALTGTHSPRAAARGGGEASAEGLEWVPGSPRGSLQHTPDPELLSFRTLGRPGPSRLSAASGSTAAVSEPAPARGRRGGGTNGGEQAGSQRGWAAAQAESFAPQAEPAGAAAFYGAAAATDEEEEEAPFPEDPGMSSFSSQASAAAAAAAPPQGSSPGSQVEQGARVGQPQPQPGSAAAALERPCFPEDTGDGKSAAPHALHQLSPSAAFTAAQGGDAGSPPATPSPSTPRKKRGGLFQR